MDLRKDYELFARSEFGIGSSKLDSYEKYMIKNSGGYVEPYILEEREMNVTQMSVFSRLFKDRILFLGTEVNSDSANILTSQLMFLNSVDDSEEIKLLQATAINLFRNLSKSLNANINSMVEILCKLRTEFDKYSK